MQTIFALKLELRGGPALTVPSLISPLGVASVELRVFVRSAGYRQIRTDVAPNNLDPVTLNFARTAWFRLPLLTRFCRVLILAIRERNVRPERIRPQNAALELFAT